MARLSNGAGSGALGYLQFVPLLLVNVNYIGPFEVLFNCSSTAGTALSTGHSRSLEGRIWRINLITHVGGFGVELENYKSPHASGKD